jgi:hypothetical protein
MKIKDVPSRIEGYLKAWNTEEFVEWWMKHDER